VNRLSEFGSGLAALCSQQEPVLAPAMLEALREAGREVDGKMKAATDPLLTSVGDSVEAILLTMHKEDFSDELETSNTNPAPSCSLYMKELQAFMERVARDFLSTFSCPQFLATQLQPLAEKTIQRFVLQGSLVRPLGSGGAMRLASDCAQLEFALSSILGPSGQSSLGPTGLIALGGSYRLLRAFRFISSPQSFPCSSISNPRGRGDLPRPWLHCTSFYRPAPCHIQMSSCLTFTSCVVGLVFVSLFYVVGRSPWGERTPSTDPGRFGGVCSSSESKTGQDFCASVSGAY